MEKEKKEYSYMIRFQKDLPLDQKALDVIAEFCEMTKMSKKDAIKILLATANVPAILEGLLSITTQPVHPEKNRKEQEIQSTPQTVPEEVLPGILESNLLDDIFNNF